MSLRDDSRGQAVQLAALVLFGAIVIWLSSYQAFVVPDQNREVEFRHSQEVQNDLEQLHRAIHSLADGGQLESVAIELGTTYTDRVLFVNPGPASGTVETVGTTDTAVNVSIRNASVAGDAGDFWNGTARNYSTGAIVYQPRYNVYENPPTTVYANSILYNRFDGGNITVAGQSLVDDDTLSLIALNGTLSESRVRSVSVDARVRSASTEQVTVTNVSAGENVTLAVPTKLSESEWESLLADERVSSGGHVYDVTTEPLSGTEFRQALIRLEAGVNYTLRMSRVGIGSNVGESPPEAYVTRTSGNGSVVSEGETVPLAVTVNDAYNNPVSGATVEAGTNRSNSSVSANATTDTDGVARVTYRAPSDIDGGDETDQVNVSLAVDPEAASTFDPTTPENVTFELTVSNTDGSGTPGPAYASIWERPPFDSGVRVESIGETDSREAVGLLMRALDGTQPVTNASVDYGYNDSSIGTLSRLNGTTNPTGYNRTLLNRTGNGTIAVYTSSGGSQDSATITLGRPLAEDFETDAGTLAANGWTYNNSVNGDGDAGIKNIGNDADSGSNVSYINGDGGAATGDRAIELSSALDTSEFDRLTLTYAAREPDPNVTDDPEAPNASSGYVPGENLRVQYLASDDNWVTVDNLSSVTDDSTELPRYYYRRVTFDFENATHSGFKLRFAQGETDDTDEWQIDTPKLVGANATGASP